jgi:anti-sigma factor RsiW
MSCAAWAGKLDAYFDGELSPEEARTFAEHLRGCAACAAEGLELVQQKRAVQAAGMKFTPDPAFRARIQKSIAPEPFWKKRWLPVALTALTALVIVGALWMNRGRGDQQLLSELVDQHVGTLASSNPVDVVSTDRHTVKPWFEGKIPFTFNLPELKGTPFTLVGGRVTYLGQSPGAQLIFRVAKHQISVFIFREQGLAATPANANALSFQVRTWSHDGLRYFAISDAGGDDLDRLNVLIKAAG